MFWIHWIEILIYAKTYVWVFLFVLRSRKIHIFSISIFVCICKLQYVIHNIILSLEKFTTTLSPENIPKFYVKSNFMLKNNLHQVMYLVVVLTSNAASALLLFTTKNLIIPLFCKLKITCKLLTNNLNNQDSSMS